MLKSETGAESFRTGTIVFRDFKTGGRLCLLGGSLQLELTIVGRPTGLFLCVAICHADWRGA